MPLGACATAAAVGFVVLGAARDRAVAMKDERARASHERDSTEGACGDRAAKQHLATMGDQARWHRPGPAQA
jgi:hypothetical protein